MESKPQNSLHLLLMSTLLLSACQSSQGVRRDSMASLSSNSKSSISSIPSVGSFACTAQGCLGTVIVKGYAEIKTETPNPVLENCGEDCADYRYISLRITDGMTQDLIRTVSNRELIGIGCPEDNNTIVSDIATHINYTTQLRMDEKYASMILKSSAAHPVIVTLIRDYEPPGGDAPHCYSFFRVVSVTQE